MNREELVRYDGEWYDANIVDCLLDENDAEIEDLLRQNRELCQALQVMYSKEEYGKLQKEIESLKATHDTEMMDAGMRERRLRRALWLARANRAVCEIDYWRKCYEHVDDYFDVRTGQDLEAKRCEKMIRNWIDVKGKCRAKAKEYL